MATITCTTTDQGSKYTCSGLFCGSKIKKLKAQDTASGNSPVSSPTAEFKVLQTQPGKDDAVIIGMNAFSVHEYDIFIIENPDKQLNVTVLKGDTVVFKTTRPERAIKYSVGQFRQMPVIEAFEEEENFVRLDTRDLDKRFLRNT